MENEYLDSMTFTFPVSDYQILQELKVDLVKEINVMAPVKYSLLIYMLES